MMAFNITNEQVFAIVVTYLPQTQLLADLLVVLAPQTAHIVVVDNTSTEDRCVADLLDELALPQVELIRLGVNLGIAKALNVGIERSIRAGATHVLLSDQDSLPDPDMVATLFDITKELKAAGVRVGSLSPEYFDNTTGQAFPLQVQVPGRLFYSSARSEQAKPYIEILTGITSGTLIPCQVFAEVGLMREDFFIDYIDTEWCHRARDMGYKLFGTAMTRLNHRLGDSCFQVWAFGWRPYNAYSPIRLYYRFRNFILLMQLGHVDLRWKIRACWYWLGNLYAYSLFAPHRWANIRMIFMGLRDGLHGRTGPLR